VILSAAGGLAVKQLLPFPVSVRPWDELLKWDRSFFCFTDDYLPLHPNHAAQIGLLTPADASRLSEWVFEAIPPGWPERGEQRFKYGARIVVRDSWHDTVRRSDVRRWLYQRGIPFRRTIYLIYERNQVVQTSWRMVVRYWDAFAWSVGYAMIAVDHTLEWACCFHHEEVFIFGTHSKRAAPETSPVCDGE
jgi:hypothetical protein